GQASIHRAPWPGAVDFDGVPAPADPGCFDAAVACLTAINKAKSEGGVSVGRGVASVTLAAHPAMIERLESVLGDVLATARVEAHDIEARASLADGTVEVVDITFVPAQEG
ncbi:MAG TPA: valine--tRNA ligase, partial [Candidatus Binatia bacterium]|nr:valine--tRNA ligase [Candidatus Binatia bacterium]